MPHDKKGFSPEVLIAYSLLPFITPSRMRSILACDGWPSISLHDAARLLNIPPEQASLAKDPLQPAKVRQQVAALVCSAVTLADEDYPPLLREIPDPPPALFVRGDRRLLASHSVAVVGSRNATPYGVNAATLLARSLSEAGVTVVSGLARGIDIAAHRAALPLPGSTIAVLGTGIDVVYPRTHRRAFEDIASGGLLVTEFAPGTPPRAGNFPVRNRIISGLALGVVVVEATPHSGSLITARMAAEQNREVFAVPGPIFSARSEGCHRLIQYGAKLVHDARDVFDEIRQIAQLSPDAGGTVASGEPDELLKLFPLEEGITCDTAAERSGRPTQDLAQDLLRLELEGKIRALPGARYIRTP
jgi:DNA processing protein